MSTQLRGNFRPDVKQGDTSEIEINCNNSKIALKNLQTSENYELPIDLQQSPFPWQILINFNRHGDRVRLFHKNIFFSF
jgi:hypothetical protein